MENGSELAYIRRWNDDLTGRKAQDAFSALVYNNEIVNITNGTWDYVRQYSGKLYFEKSNEKGEIVRSENRSAIYSAYLHPKHISHSHIPE